MKVGKPSSYSFTLLRSLKQGWLGDCCVESKTPANKGRRGKQLSFFIYYIPILSLYLWGRARSHNSYKWWILHTNVALQISPFRPQNQTHMLVNKWNRVYHVYACEHVSHAQSLCIFVCTCLTSGNREGPMRACTRVIFVGWNNHFNAQ